MEAGDWPVNSKGKLKFLLIPFISSLVLLFSVRNITNAEKIVEVKGLRYWSSPGYTRVVVDISGPVDFTKNRLSSPERLYFDLKNSRITKAIQTSLPVGDGILKMVRAGQFTADTVRVVLDLEEIKDYRTFVLDDPSRLVIDIYGFPEKSGKHHENLYTIKRVVLDPGHGGHDPGAIGPNGLREKDVVLDIALKMKGILEKEFSIETILTRDSDIFIPLEERTAIANSKRADLFVSIHTNASPRKAARGIETYFLNWTNDAEAIRVAARENAISVKKMKEAHTELGMILASLERENKRDESIKLAHYVQDSLVSNIKKSYKRVTDLGVKQALFYVLVGATMPSVLVEVSFISNPEEENMLAKESYRLQIAKALSKGINTYVNSLPVSHKVAKLR